MGDIFPTLNVLDPADYSACFNKNSDFSRCDAEIISNNMLLREKKLYLSLIDKDLDFIEAYVDSLTPKNIFSVIFSSDEKFAKYSVALQVLEDKHAGFNRFEKKNEDVYFNRSSIDDKFIF